MTVRTKEHGKSLSYSTKIRTNHTHNDMENNGVNKEGRKKNPRNPPRDLTTLDESSKHLLPHFPHKQPLTCILQLLHHHLPFYSYPRRSGTGNE